MTSAAARRVVVPPVSVRAPVDPHRLRAAIEARLADRAWPAGGEADVAAAVERAVTGRSADDGGGVA
jgi:hypothetical protein